MKLEPAGQIDPLGTGKRNRFFQNVEIGLAAIDFGLGYRLRIDWHRQTKGRPGAFCMSAPQFAFMRFNNGTANGQTHPSPFSFVVKKLSKGLSGSCNPMP